MITLALDASTYAGSVALLDDSGVLGERRVAMKGAEHERLMPAVADCLSDAGVSVDRIGRIVCGEGPGSFTSLRIAGSIAKGLATGLGRPLYAVPSMALIVGNAPVGPGTYLVAVDALRGELYVGLYDVTESRAIDEREPARLIEAGALMQLAADYDATILGAAGLERSVDVSPSARSVARLEAMLAERGPVDVASWEPAYGRLAEAQVKWEAAHGRPLRVS